MKKHFAALMILLVAFTIITSCKKDDEPKQPSKTDILTAKSWRFQDATAMGYSLTTLGLTDVLGSVSNSDYKFNADGTYTATNRSNNSTVQGKWEFGSNETKLILDKGTEDETTFDIITLTDKNLDLRLSIDKSTINPSLLPETLRALLIVAPASIAVDIKLIPS